MQTYLIGYDIAEGRRQARMRYQVKQHSISGQRSAYECWLSDIELEDLSTYATETLEETDAYFTIKIKQTYWQQKSACDISNYVISDTNHILVG